MLTYVDKLLYKYDAGYKFTKTELSFFDVRIIAKIKRELSKHRLEQK